jgi:acetylornithine deacetylase/succinyl-diaminopimelate desuccinylase-like protein
MLLDTSAIIRWLTSFVQIPSVGPANAGARSGASSEARLAAQMAEWFAALGGEVETEDVYPGRPNVYGIWRGTGTRWLAVDVHLDTVGVESMEGDPFDGRVSDGRVYGRGSVDTKASFAIVLAWLEALQARGATLPCNLVVCGTADEETGLRGAFVFREWVRRKGLHLDELIVAEPTLCSPVYGHKGALGVVVEIEGMPVHSSRPEAGRNAIAAAAPVISALVQEHERLRAAPAATALGSGTISVTMIQGGQALNIIPDLCTISIDRRLTVGEDPDAEFARITDLVRAACPLPLTTRTMHRLHPYYQSPDTPFIQQISAWSGGAPDVAAYASNACAYDGIADAVVVFGPGSIEQAHRDVEWVEIAELERAAQVYARWWGIEE